MSSIYSATSFKIGMYLLNKEKHIFRFSEITDLIQVLNEMQTDKRHMRVQQDNKKKMVFKIYLLRCATRPDLSGVPLT